MSKNIERRETMWAEMKTDTYAGDTCDQHEPRWYTYADGDKEAGYEHGDLLLGGEHFPPGTRVVVSEPVCSSCHMIPSAVHRDGPFKGPVLMWECDCDFDWKSWTEEQYG